MSPGKQASGVLSQYGLLLLRDPVPDAAWLHVRPPRAQLPQTGPQLPILCRPAHIKSHQFMDHGKVNYVVQGAGILSCQ